VSLQQLFCRVPGGGRIILCQPTFLPHRLDNECSSLRLPTLDLPAASLASANKILDDSDLCNFSSNHIFSTCCRLHDRQVLKTHIYSCRPGSPARPPVKQRAKQRPPSPTRPPLPPPILRLLPRRSRRLPPRCRALGSVKAIQVRPRVPPSRRHRLAGPSDNGWHSHHHHIPNQLPSRHRLHLLHHAAGRARFPLLCRVQGALVPGGRCQKKETKWG
jgi:hypothetical protein